jgi:hypothetical protein
MTTELIAMFGGSVVGFIMKLIASQQQNQAAQFEMMLKKQELADISADKAAARGGVWMRRLITVSVLFAVIALPAIFAFTDIGVTIEKETKGFLGLFKGSTWETIGGYVILPEIRQTTLAIVGFYFGSSQVK